MTVKKLNLLLNLFRWYSAITPEHRGKDRLRRLIFTREVQKDELVEVPLYPFNKLRMRVRTNHEIDKDIFLNGLYEKNYALKFCKLIRPGDTVMDIGANSGQYTLLASLVTGASGKVYAFEPAPHKYQELVDNVKLNELANVLCLEYALSDCTGTGYLNILRDRNDGMHHLVLSENAHTASAVEVPIYTLDYLNSCLLQGCAVDVIKIDVEGWEEAVLRGGSAIFSQEKLPTIFFESIEEHANRFGFSAWRVRQMLIDKGYCLFGRDSHSGKWVKVSPSDAEQINLFAIHSSRPHLITLLQH